MTTHVLLLHGLWMRGITMSVLQHRLEKSGFEVSVFDYWSIRSPLHDTLQNLRERMCATGDKVHLVGHSLGGVLAVLACRDAQDLPPGRIVCLASPLTGSSVAREFTNHGGGWLLGDNRQLLQEGLKPWQGQREIGVVAGTLSMGLGAVTRRLEGANDGTVATRETRLEGITDYCEVNASHTGMLISRDAAIKTLLFLHTGRFANPTDA